ncbi:MAG: hypothetical protein Q8930_04000 [Bacillota bacterium]|nr:hypothetical protein [Bacillota bacterium]
MLNKKEILSYLEANGLDDYEEIEYKEDALLLRVYYDFDSDEISSAKAYSNDECEDEEESETWFDEFFLPYLNDIAVDNVGEVIEELMEDKELNAQYVIYETDSENYETCEFIVVFSEKDKEYEIEEILDELEL